ncbi:MAG: hypothetical protein RRZ24_02490, partial [Clostridia bacterium]
STGYARDAPAQRYNLSCGITPTSTGYAHDAPAQRCNPYCRKSRSSGRMRAMPLVEHAHENKLCIFTT